MLFATICLIHFWSLSCILLMAVSASIAKIFIRLYVCSVGYVSNFCPRVSFLLP
jgi:hypothetical protein